MKTSKGSAPPHPKGQEPQNSSSSEDSASLLRRYIELKRLREQVRRAEEKIRTQP